jgi:hypothetical protein
MFLRVNNICTTMRKNLTTHIYICTQWKKTTTTKGMSPSPKRHIFTTVMPSFTITLCLFFWTIPGIFSPFKSTRRKPRDNCSKFHSGRTLIRTERLLTRIDLSYRINLFRRRVSPFRRRVSPGLPGQCGSELIRRINIDPRWPVTRIRVDPSDKHWPTLTCHADKPI